MRITSGGNVGINKSNPHSAYGMDVVSPGAGALLIENSKPIAAHGNGGNYGLIRLDAANRVRVGDAQVTIQEAESVSEYLAATFQAHRRWRWRDGWSLSCLHDQTTPVWGSERVEVASATTITSPHDITDNSPSTAPVW